MPTIEVEVLPDPIIMSPANAFTEIIPPALEMMLPAPSFCITLVPVIVMLPESDVKAAPMVTKPV